MSRAAGRHTRPKKLNAKQNVPIFREDQVDSLVDYDLQRAAIDTGVEKAEESVCCSPCSPLSRAFVPVFSASGSFLSLCPLPSCLVIITTRLSKTPSGSPIHSWSHHLLTPLVLARNTICNKPSKQLKPTRQMPKPKMHTFQLHLPLPVIFRMILCIPRAFNSLPHISAFQLQSKTVLEWHIAWMKRTSLP